MIEPSLNPASFKDPAGFVFQQNSKIYRQVNLFYARDYDQLMNSGLYELFPQELLLTHVESSELLLPRHSPYKIITPQLSFIGSHTRELNMLKMRVPHLQ